MLTNIDNNIDTTIYNTQYIHMYILHIILISVNTDNRYTKERITKTDKQQMKLGHNAN